jgi:DNA repair protein RecO (recombination protein O)
MTRRLSDEPAYLLHARAYRESSALLELLTAHYGCVSVVGRGLKGQRRRRVPTPFVRMRLACSGRGALLTLTAFETEGQHALEGDALFSGLYLNELLLRLVRHEDPHPALFDGYETALAGLAAGADVEACLRRFELLLLRECGYELTFDVDAGSGEPIVPDAVYAFEADHGFVRSDGLPDERGSFRGATLLAIKEDDLTDREVRRAAKRILRQALEPHLGARPLESRRLFEHRRSS